ncbi:Macrophage-stimulating protein receptor [Folsomia candida]|uniref:Macrophage-stimulating protein receptor n=1 Tax=Folsomia candida TaxID=158441 RepID=A0A226EAA3_FOLCA|nr:Macrophage-stimulating protein receptor [Folsomia candida]
MLDPRYCGTIETDYFSNRNQTILTITEETELEMEHFEAVSLTLMSGNKYINVSNPNCKVTICHQVPEESAECMHFYHEGFNNSYVTDHTYVITSISCGCLNLTSPSRACSLPTPTKEVSSWPTRDTKLAEECPPRQMAGDTCAILFQEYGCESCLYDGIHLTATGPESTFKTRNHAVIRSIVVADRCTLTFISFDCTCKPKPDDGLSVGTISGISVASVVLLLGSLIAGYLLKRKNRKVKFTEAETEELKLELFGEPDAIPVISVGENDPSSGGNLMNGDYSVKRQNIEVLKDCLLGKGNYGVVLKGNLISEVDNSRVVCAIKTVDERTARIDDLKLLVNEIRIMSAVGHHPNAVSFLGFHCNFHPSKWEFLCLMEICVGNLHDHLCRGKQNAGRSTIDVTLQKAGYVLYADNSDVGDQSAEKSPSETMCVTLADMKKWSAHIADGMEYLTTKKLLHVDLATRNVLLSEDLTAKISDFGLSKKLYDSLYYKKAHGANIWVPMKWSAFESLMSLKFSTESDIWSYGVTIWEIFSLGDEPYPDLEDMLDMIRFLNSGQRLPCPKSCDAETCNLMQQCWEIDITKRPTFNDLSKFFTL